MLGGEVVKLLSLFFHHCNISCKEWKDLFPIGTLKNKWTLPVHVFMTLWMVCLFSSLCLHRVKCVCVCDMRYDQEKNKLIILSCKMELRLQIWWEFSLFKDVTMDAKIFMAASLHYIAFGHCFVSKHSNLLLWNYLLLNYFGYSQ